MLCLASAHSGRVNEMYRHAYGTVNDIMFFVMLVIQNVMIGGLYYTWIHLGKEERSEKKVCMDIMTKVWVST